jgi:hypothetical protein
MWSTLASWLQHIHRLLIKFSNTHNFWLIGPKIMKFVLPWSLFRDACSQKVSKILKISWDQMMLPKTGLSAIRTSSPLGANCWGLSSFSWVWNWWIVLELLTYYLTMIWLPELYVSHMSHSPRKKWHSCWTAGAAEKLKSMCNCSQNKAT